MFKTYFIYQDQDEKTYLVETGTTRKKGDKLIRLLNPQTFKTVKVIDVVALFDYDLIDAVVYDKDGKKVNY